MAISLALPAGSATYLLNGLRQDTKPKSASIGTYLAELCEDYKPYKKALSAEPAPSKFCVLAILSYGLPSPHQFKVAWSGSDGDMY